MNIPFYILLLAGIVILMRKVFKTSEQMDVLHQLVTRLETDVERLKVQLSRPRPGESTPAERSHPGTIEALLESRRADETPPTPENLPPRLRGPTIHIPPAEPSLAAPTGATARSSERTPTSASATATPPPLSTPPPGFQAARTSSPAPISKPPVSINWERFMGVNLFAWVGGLALFLGVAFFVKYSFEHNLVPPEVRVALGFLTGIGLLVGGILMKRKDSVVTAQTLSATGVLILYAVSFACHSYYHFSGAAATFAMMVMITATAFLLAARMDAKVVAVLGLFGGFLTPPLLSTGEDKALGLFTYIAILNAGLLAVAFHRRWDFLAILGAIGTVVIQLGWVGKFFAVEKVFVALAIFLGFDLLFLIAFVVAEKLKQSNQYLSISSILLPFVTLSFASYLLSYPELGARPGTIFSFVLAADLCLLALVLLRHTLHQVHLIAGAAAFLILAAWTTGHLTTGLLNWALGFYLLFAALHAVFPVVLQRLRPGIAPVWWGHLFPPVALLLVLIPLLKETTVSWLIWPCVLLIDLVAIGLALLTASLLAILGVLVLTVAVTAVWILKVPVELTGLPPMLVVIGGFAVFFFIVSIFAEKKILAKLAALDAPSGIPSVTGAGATPEDEMLRQIPALSAILPFLLLIMAAVRLPILNPSPIFGLALLLVALLLGVARASTVDALAPVGLACVLALEHAWHLEHFTPQAATVPLLWYLAFSVVFLAFSFIFRQAIKTRVLPWAAAALSLPLHFFLIYRVVDLAFPNGYMGLLPAALSVPLLAGLFYLVRNIAAAQPERNALLAWFGGCALFFVTLIFPIQFERQWITIGWALEGVALLWLFQRVPHPGLRATGVALLAVAFVRLTLNPSVLSYHPRSEVPILNWYLYTYAIPTLCLMFAARLLAPPRNRVWDINMPPLLYGAGTVLAFLVVNIEIADYFATGPTLVFQFSGNLARDMTYSIAWALFALVLLIVGIWQRLRAVRYASLGLLAVTLLKLFVHDLSQLGQLYRIGAFIGVAIILILASYLYQRFVSWDAGGEKSGN